MQNSLKRTWALIGAVAALAAVVATTATAAHKAVNIVIWTDSDRAAAVTKVANDWAAKNGATVKVVTKNFGDIRDNLGTVAAADAPDVITAAHDWTGQLAANGLVQPLFPSAASSRSSRRTRLTPSRTGRQSRSRTASRRPARTSASSLKPNPRKPPKTSRYSCT